MIHEMFLSAANRWPEYKDKEAEVLEPETSSKLRTQQKRMTKAEKKELQKQTDIKLDTSSEVKTSSTKFEPLDLSEMRMNFVIYAQTKETLTPEQAHVLLQDPQRWAFWKFKNAIRTGERER